MNKALLPELISRDLKLKYRRSVFGYLWSLLNPLLMMFVISTVFSHFFRFEIENYTIYLLAGQIFFIFFNESTTMAMMSIIGSANLIKKVYVPKYIFPVSKVLSSFVNLLFSLIAIVIMLIVTQTKITWAILMFPLPLIFILLFSMGIGMILSVLAVYFRDMTHLYSVLTTAWMYLTPIFYPIESLPPEVINIIEYNPLYHIITCFRYIILHGQVPSLDNILTCTWICLATLVLGILLFKRKQSNFILYV